MLKTDKIHYDMFQHNIRRAKALITVQDTIDWLIDNDFNIQPMINKFLEKLGIPNLMPVISPKIEQAVTEDKEFTKKIEEIVKNFKVNQKDIKKMVMPIVRALESIEALYDHPLYYEAVVIIVGAFEIYLKETMVTLVSRNKSVEMKFYDMLKSKLSYDKLKEYDYDWEYILGYIIGENYNWFETQQMDNAYTKVLNIESIFQNKNVEKRIRNFIKLRHLIVHNAGIVDRKFQTETHTKVPIDQPYPVEKKYVLDMIGLIVKVVDGIETEIHGKGGKKR